MKLIQFSRRRILTLLAVALVITGSLVTTGCPKVKKEDVNDPTKREEIVKNMRGASTSFDLSAVGIEETANTFRDLNAAQAISRDSAIKATKGLLKANRIGEEGARGFLNVQNLDDAARGNLARIIGEFRGGLDSLLGDGTLQIKNPKTQLWVFVGLRSSSVGLALLQSKFENGFEQGVSIPVDEQTKRTLERALKRFESTTKRLRDDLEKLEATPAPSPAALPSPSPTASPSPLEQ